jgi:ADP-ribose pyrophosphatase YjhB (NUDIX family)
MNITKLEQVPKPYEVEFENLPVLADSDFGFEPEKQENIKLYRPTVRIFCFDTENNIGLVQSKYSDELFHIPGGGVEDLETLKESARREVLEELGDEIDSVKPIARYINRKWGSFYDIYFFTASITKKGDPVTTQVDEKGKMVIYKTKLECLELFDNQYKMDHNDSQSLVTRYFLNELSN